MLSGARLKRRHGLVYEYPFGRYEEKGVHSAEIGWQQVAFPLTFSICPASLRTKTNIHASRLSGKEDWGRRLESEGDL